MGRHCTVSGATIRAIDVFMKQGYTYREIGGFLGINLQKVGNYSLRKHKTEPIPDPKETASLFRELAQKLDNEVLTRPTEGNQAVQYKDIRTQDHAKQTA